MERHKSQKLNVKSSNNIFQISNKKSIFQTAPAAHPTLNPNFQTVDHLFEMEGGNTIPKLHSHFWFLVNIMLFYYYYYTVNAMCIMNI